MGKDMEGNAEIENPAPKAQEGFFSATLTPGNIADKTMIPSRYMGASVGSCHDFCKYGMKQDLNKEQKDSSRRNSGHKSCDTKRGLGFATMMMKDEFSRQEAFESQNSSGSLVQERKFSPLSKVCASPSTAGMSVNASRTEPLSDSPKVGKFRCSSKVRELRNLGKRISKDGQAKSQIKPVVKKRISKDTSRPPFSTSPQVPVAKVDSKVGRLCKKRNVMRLRSPNKAEAPKLEGRGVFTSDPGIKSVNCMPMERPGQVRRPVVSIRAKNLKRCQSDSMASRLPSPLEKTKRALRSTRSGIHRNPSSLSMSASTKTRALRLVQTVPVDVTLTHREAKDSSQNSNIEAKEQALDLSEESTVHSHTAKRVKKPIQETHHAPPVKLKFRRGKSVDLRDQKSSPWKMVLRRGRILSEPQHAPGVTRLRSFKRSGTVDDMLNLKGKTSREKVVLRHQDVVENKTIQNSFNNVIEETASKLVETRKSKVKALVGAFETVFSLQSY
uniref:Calmodulin-binding domain-containing protein n=1 Tax=Kalanchoe fedtschenkoi TaxID=63787 RepID=A0A7N0TMZ8_KALFE